MFNIAILSIPKPNAKPLNLLESIWQFSSTIGFIIPQPRISSHLPSSDKISTSADGSVNGKYERSKSYSIFSPKSELIILYINPLDRKN